MVYRSMPKFHMSVAGEYSTLPCALARVKCTSGASSSGAVCPSAPRQPLATFSARSHHAAFSVHVPSASAAGSALRGAVCSCVLERMRGKCDDEVVRGDCSRSLLCVRISAFGVDDDLSGTGNVSLVSLPSAASLLAPKVDAFVVDVADADNLPATCAAAPLPPPPTLLLSPTATPVLCALFFGALLRNARAASSDAIFTLI